MKKPEVVVYSQTQIIFKPGYFQYGDTLDAGTSAIVVQTELKVPLLSGKKRKLVCDHHDAGGASFDKMVSVLTYGCALKILHASRGNLCNVQCYNSRTKYPLSTFNIDQIHSCFSGPSRYPQISRN